MRLEQIAPAVAILLVVAAGVGPGASAASAPVASIVSPSPGATLLESGVVRVSYSGHSPQAEYVAGYLLLDGEPAGTFHAHVASTTSTTFNATLRAANFTSGPHELSARVFTDLDDPVDAPAVPIVLDTRPAIADLAYSYDLDARALVVGATVTDDGGSSTVRLSSGSQSLNATADGPVHLALPAPRGEGSYDATLEAKDAAGQVSRVGFTYTVGDREAELSVDDASYRLGGRLEVSGTIADDDGPVHVQVLTPLGNGSADSNASEWSVVVRVRPELGTFEGTVRSFDRFGGVTSVPFTFTIGGAREQVYERQVETHAGAYADRSLLALPPLLDAAFEICVEACDDRPSPLEQNATARERETKAMGYALLCAHYENPHCRALTGRPVFAGATDLCRSDPPHSFPGGTIRLPVVDQSLGSVVWTMRETIDNGTHDAVGREVVCRDLYGSDVNASHAGKLPEADHVAVVASSTFFTCGSMGGDTRCDFDAPGGLKVDLSWSQGPMRTVTVRVSGVRV